MKALYHYFANKWGEPEQLIWFDPDIANRQCALKKIHIGYWPSEEECDVNSFVSFGMSEIEMGEDGSGIRAELQFAIRGKLTHEEIHEVAKFLANVAEYPFANNLALDWWHSLRDSGKVPCFPEVSKILFRPAFTDTACSETVYQEETIKFLFVVPLTEEEDHVVTMHGANAYQDYMDRNGFDLLGHK